MAMAKSLYFDISSIDLIKYLGQFGKKATKQAQVIVFNSVLVSCKKHCIESGNFFRITLVVADLLGYHTYS